MPRRAPRQRESENQSLESEVARFYQGLAAQQDGNSAEAARLWRGLLADAPEAAPWAASVRQALARVDPAAAGEMPAAKTNAKRAGDEPSGQDAMIRGMVERLAARLRQDGSDVDGWVRLVRFRAGARGCGRGPRGARKRSRETAPAG